MTLEKLILTLENQTSRVIDSWVSDPVESPGNGWWYAFQVAPHRRVNAVVLSALNIAGNWPYLESPGCRDFGGDLTNCSSPHGMEFSRCWLYWKSKSLLFPRSGGVGVVTIDWPVHNLVPFMPCWSDSYHSKIFSSTVTTLQYWTLHCKIETQKFHIIYLEPISLFNHTSVYNYTSVSLNT
jgi:hypothetical protein